MAEWTTQWWMWALLGIGLLILEIMTPGGFFVVFFGLAALLVGILVGFGIGGPLWLQMLLFSLISVVSLVLFRKRLLDKFKPNQDLTRDLGDVVGGIATALEDLPPGSIGKAEFRGTSWTIRNVGETPLAKGSRCKVGSIDGLTLRVSKEDL